VTFLYVWMVRLGLGEWWGLVLKLQSNKEGMLF